MKIFGIIIKVLIAIAANIFVLHPSDPGAALVAFAAVYGLISLYIWYFSNNDIFVGAGGLMSHVWALIINLCLPCLIVVVPLFILEAILPGEIGGIIYGIIVLILCVGCLLLDVLHVVRSFKPDFLAGVPDFPGKKKAADGE